MDIWEKNCMYLFGGVRLWVNFFESIDYLLWVFIFFFLWFKLVGVVVLVNYEFDNEYGVVDECSIYFFWCFVIVRYFYFKYFVIIFEKKMDFVLWKS